MAIRVSTLVATVVSCFPALVIVAILHNYQAIDFTIAFIIVGGTFYLVELFRAGRL